MVDSRAELVESYQENDRSVYAVSISAGEDNAKFGTFLSREEKDWLVERINRHLSEEAAWHGVSDSGEVW